MTLKCNICGGAAPSDYWVWVAARPSCHGLLLARSIMLLLRGKYTYPGGSDFRNHRDRWSIAYMLFHLYWMLSSRGRHVFVVPFTPGALEEYFQTLSSEERTRRFGQWDHVRRFGTALARLPRKHGSRCQQGRLSTAMRPATAGTKERD
jgi:hypothetical protein